MKKLFLLFFMLIPLLSFSYDKDPPEDTPYCMLIATQIPMSSKIAINIDYGGEVEAIKENNKYKKFTSIVEALNYMNARGWKFVHTYNVEIAGQNVYNYLLYRPKLE